MVELVRSLGLSAGRPTPLLAMMGDSRLANGKTISGNDLFRYMHGVGSWVGILTGGKVKAPLSHNRARVTSSLISYVGDGYSGGSGTPGSVGIVPADGSAGQLAEVLALSPRPTHCLILTGTNDIAYGVQSVSQMQATMISVWTSLLNAGIVPVTLLDLPRGWTTAPYRQKHFQWNSWLIKNGASYGSVVIDATPSLMNIASANGDPLSELYYDSPAIHPGNLGSYYAASKIAAYFNSMYLATPFRGFSPGDLYDATNNPGGNLIPYGGVGYGSAGTKSGANVTGSVWSGMQVALLSGSVTSCVCSIDARSDGGAGNWQTLTLTTSGAASLWFYPISDIPVSAGDVLEFGFDFDAASLNSNVSSIAGRLIDNNVNTALATYWPMLFDTTKGGLPTAFSGRAEMDPMTMLAATTRAVPIMSVTVTGAVTSAVVRFGGVSLRKVT